jgi:uncharacterized protein (DUF849 family)
MSNQKTKTGFELSLEETQKWPPTGMKVMDMKKHAKEYLSLSPEKTHTKEELEAVHRAIKFTALFKHKESMSKMDEEEKIVRPVLRF